VDEDCDGAADSADPHAASDALTFYRDRDRDGFGDDRFPAVGCEVFIGHASVSGDCDDWDAAVWPGAPEACEYDSWDEDCDGSPPWYVDRDGDGAGTEVVGSCNQPRGPLSGDCDDADPSVHPLAVEVCADRVDQDCDRNAAPCGIEGYFDLSVEPRALDAYLVRAGDLDGDGHVDLVTMWGWEAAVYAGPFDGSFVARTSAVLTVPGPGLQGIWLADADGDGADEIVVTDDTGVADRIWVDGARSGAIDGTTAATMLIGAEATGAPLDSNGDGLLEFPTLGAVVGDVESGTWASADAEVARFVGRAPVALGDVDGDGLDDVAWSGGPDPLVAFGPLSGAYGAAEADHVVSGVSTVNAHPFAPGDLDGDGTADLLVFAEDALAGARDHCGEPVHGTLLLLYAPFATDLLDADASFEEENARAVEGPAGDFDDDGHVDLFAPMPALCDAGRTWAMVLPGPFSGVISDSDAAVINWRLQVPILSAPAADLDGDGVEDLVVSDRDGRAWFFFGGPGL
jgi:hypothetical protein